MSLPPDIHLPEEKLAEIEMLFEKFDVEGTHLIYSDELETIVRMLGYDPDWKELRYLQSKLRGLDLMELKQLIKIIAEQEIKYDGKKGYKEKDILATFRSWDPEKTGYISKEHFKDWMRNRGDVMEEDELEEMLKAMQPDEENQDNDRIEYEPFIKKIFQDEAVAREAHEEEIKEFMKIKEDRGEYYYY